MYAYFKKLDYFSTECIYSPNAYRGYARTFLKDLEAIRPSAILDIIKAGETFEGGSMPKLHESVQGNQLVILHMHFIKTLNVMYNRQSSRWVL